MLDGKAATLAMYVPISNDLIFRILLLIAIVVIVSLSSVAFVIWRNWRIK
jgi:hypothetical protein